MTPVNLRLNFERAMATLDAQKSLGEPRGD